LKERPVREEPFTVVPTTLIVLMRYGISPFLRNVPSAVSPSWLRSMEREGLPNDVLRKNVDIVKQNKSVSPRCDSKKYLKPKFHMNFK
jgi:hypothetical protein